MPLTFKRNIYLDRLDRVMGYDFSSKTPSIAYLNMDGVARSWILISVIATPYVLWLLYKLKKLGWLISFLIFVFAPFLFNYFKVVNTNASFLISAITIVNWVVFLFLLKNSYQNWREPDFKNAPSSDFE